MNECMNKKIKKNFRKIKIADPFFLHHSLEETKAYIHNTSFWELQTLENHYHSLVSRLVLMFKNRLMFKKGCQGVDVNEFLDLGHGDLIEQEMK